MIEKIKFGMPTLIECPTLEENARLCHELGLDFIELNMNFPQYQIKQLENTEYLTEIAEKYNLFYTIHLDENMDICNFNYLVADAYLETVRRTIEVAKKLHIPVLNMHMNHGIYTTLPDRKVRMYQEYFTEYMEGVRKFRDMCEQIIGGADIKICIENTDGYLDFEKNAIEYLLESKVFALTWDIGHSHGTKNIDEPFLMEHHNKLSHFHVHDGLGTKNHQTLGTGEIDLAQRLSIAKEHNCRCVVETKTVDALRKSIEYLTKTDFK